MPCTSSSSGCVPSSRTGWPKRQRTLPFKMPLPTTGSAALRTGLAPPARLAPRRRPVCWALVYLACVGSALVPLTSCKPQLQVNIYNWADFIGSGTVAQFERQTGIKVVYDTYDSEETAETRLMAGGSDY